MNDVCVVKVNLDNASIRPRVVVAPGGGTAWLSELASSVGGIAAINGDYFSGCPDTVSPLNCGEGLTFVDGVDYTDYTGSEWINRRSLGFNTGYYPNIDFPGGQGSYHWRTLGGGPQVTFNGEYRWRCWYQSYNTEGDCTADANNQVVINDEIFKGATNWWNRPQSFIGFSQDRKTLYLAKTYSNKTIHQMHDVLWQQGGRYSLKLDGGGSSGLYFNDGGYFINWNGSTRVANAWVIVPESAPPPQKPNLTPYTPSGWDFPLVPSSRTGTHNVDTLYAGQPTYIDLAVINNGQTSTSGQFYVRVYEDGNQIGEGSYSSDLPPGYYIVVEDWAYTFSAGYHTLKIVADPTGAIDESNEGDNSWERQFYFELAGPLITVDDVWTTDENDNPKSSFNAGDPIRLKMTINNRGSSTIRARVTWDVRDPSGNPYPPLSWDGDLDLEPGVRFWTLQTSIPSNAPTGTYSFTGRVNNGGEISSESTTFYVQGLPRPNAPSNLSASAVSQSQINLSWTDNSADESAFLIERSLTGSSDWTLIDWVGANVTSYQDSGLACGSTYYYRVMADRSSDNQYSDYSNVAHAMTQSCGVVGPLAYWSHMVDDNNIGESSGNNDGIVDCGETIELYATLYNQGSDTATGVNATISTTDPYVTWLFNVDSDYPDIPGGESRTNIYDFDLKVDPSTPDAHVIHFDLDITASNGGPWSDSFDVPVVCSLGPLPDLSAWASPDPVMMEAGEYRQITYHFSESAGTSVHITSRTALFTTLTGTPLSGQIGPYANDINVPANGTASWVDNVYLPPDVVDAASQAGVSSVVLHTTFSGNDAYGRSVSVEATLQIHLVKSKIFLPIIFRGH